MSIPEHSAAETELLSLTTITRPPPAFSTAHFIAPRQAVLFDTYCLVFCEAELLSKDVSLLQATLLRHIAHFPLHLLLQLLHTKCKQSCTTNLWVMLSRQMGHVRTRSPDFADLIASKDSIANAPLAQLSLRESSTFIISSQTWRSHNPRADEISTPAMRLHADLAFGPSSCTSRLFKRPMGSIYSVRT